MRIEIVRVKELQGGVKQFAVLQDGIASVGWRLLENGMIKPPSRQVGKHIYDTIWRDISDQQAWEELERAIHNHFAPTKPQTNETSKRKFCRGCYLEKPRGDIAHIADCPQAKTSELVEN